MDWHQLGQDGVLSKGHSTSGDGTYSLVLGEIVRPSHIVVVEGDQGLGLSARKRGLGQISRSDDDTP